MSENRVSSYQQPFMDVFIVIHAFLSIFKGIRIYAITIQVLNISRAPKSWIYPLWTRSEQYWYSLLRRVWSSFFGRRLKEPH